MLAMTGLAMTGLSAALAQDPPQPAPSPPTQTESTQTESTQVTAPKWKMNPFFRPRVGISSWAGAAGSRVSALNAGALAGSSFSQITRARPRIQGLARAQATWLVFGGQSISGNDVRVGAFAGPAWKRISFRTGPDVYRDVYQWGATELAPTVGLAWPVQAFTGIGPLSLALGIEPSFFLLSERPSVDWSEQSLPGFGDEFSYFVSGSFGVDALRLNLSYSQTTTAFGNQRGIGVGLSAGR